MVYKPLGIDENSLLPPRVMAMLNDLFVPREVYEGTVAQVTALEQQPDPTDAFRFRSMADLSFTTINFVDAAGFAWTAEPNTNYEFRYKLRVQSTSLNGDIKFQFTGPTGATVRMDVYGGGAGLTADGGGSFRTASRVGWLQSSTGFGTVATQPQIVFIELDVQVGATGGVVQMQASQNTADAAPSLIVTGSGFDGVVV